MTASKGILRPQDRADFNFKELEVLKTEGRLMRKETKSGF